jgi:hypothetical protein
MMPRFGNGHGNASKMKKFTIAIRQHSNSTLAIALLKKCDKFFENFLDAFFQDYEKAS